jgi:WD40 repeat protein/serine/threonine protein kinase/tetratricopeptide (TPR) repeat protein
VNEHELFASALEIVAPAERSAYLDRACGGDDAMRARVEALLRAHERAGSFLQAPHIAGSETLDAPKPLEGRGTAIGPYKLLQTIGEGGMGTVYMAEQTTPVRRLVALKVIKAGMDTRQVLARFGAERQALALMDHPNIARVLDAGATETGRPYFVMELVKGVPITRFCDDRRLTLRERLELFVPVCQAVQHAHQKGIIHRDLKPSNVLIAQYELGAPGVPKVIDFGVAKATGPRLTDQTLYTEFGSIVGTLEYMSPEQAELNQLDVDTRSDVYSLGAILYELLTGSTPMGRERLRAGAFVEMLRIIREEECPRPSMRLSTTEELPTIAACRQVEPRKLSGLVRGELDWIVMKALEKDRNRRYETANNFAQDIQRYLSDEPVQACPPSAWYRFRKFARRNRPALATASVVAASLVAVAVLSVLYADRQRRFGIEKEEAAGKITTLARDLTTSLAESNRLLAIRNFDRGQAAFEKDQIGQGLLWMIESWRAAIAAGDPAWQHASRANVAAWQPYHPRLKAVLSHRSAVDAAAFSPDGKMILTGGDDHMARLWNVATARPIGEPLAHGDTVLAVAFSPDGEHLLTGSADRTARLWNAATRKPIVRPLPHRDQVLTVAFRPDGRIALTGSRSGEVRLWDATTGEPGGEFLMHPSAVTVAAFSPDGKTIVTAGGLQVRLWDAAARTLIREPLQLQSFVQSLAFSPDGKTIVTGSQNGTVQLWDAASGETISSPRKRHSDRVRGVAFSADSQTLLTGSRDGTARLWDIATDQPIGRPVQHRGPVVVVTFSPDSTTMLTVSSDSTVKLWDPLPYNPVTAILERQNSASYQAFSPDGKLAFVVSGDGPPPRAEEGSIICKIPDPGATLAINPRTRTILTASSQGVARLWNGATGQPIGIPLDVLAPPATTTAAFSHDGKTLLILGPGNVARLWDAASATPLGKPFPQPGEIGGVTFSPDGRSFLTGHGSGVVQMWDVATGNPIGESIPHPGSIDSLAYSPDGRSFLTGCEDGGARLWDAVTRSLRLPPLPHLQWVWSVGFNPDGKTLVTGSGNGAARLWDATTGMPLGPTLTTSQFNVVGVAFSRDGRNLYTSSDAVRRFQIPWELPDDLDRIGTWVEVLTGLTLDPKQGSIHVLDNATWLERRARLDQLGGPPEARAESGLDCILVGSDPTARVRSLLEQRRWEAAEAAFAEAARARPYNAAIWLVRGRFHIARGRPEMAAADFEQAIRDLPQHLQIRYYHILSLLAFGDEAGLRRACWELLDRFGSSTGSGTANDVAWYCVLAPDAVADREAPVRLAELAVNEAPEAQRPMYLNTLGAALYRAGRFREAITRLEEGIRKRGDESLPQDWTFLALAHHQLGQHGEAHSWLGRFRTYRPNVNSSAFWNELEIRLLRGEAEAVIRYDPIFPTDPFSH